MKRLKELFRIKPYKVSIENDGENTSVEMSGNSADLVNGMLQAIARVIVKTFDSSHYDEIVEAIANTLTASIKHEHDELETGGVTDYDRLRDFN